MRAPILLAAALVLATAACNDLLESEGVDTAVVSLSAYSNGSGGFLLSPVAIVYANGNVQLDQPSVGQCGTIAYNPNASTVFGGGATMNVGPYMLADLPDRQDTLYSHVEFGIRLYRLGHQGGVLYTPGDTVTITIPAGTDFPETAVDVRTAEEISHDDVPVPAVNDPVTLIWRGEAEPGSAIRYSLRYANELSNGALNEQVVCFFSDNGTAQIPGSFLQGWVNATGGQRQVAVTRIRTREVQLSSDSRIAILSTFQAPTPLLTP